MFKVPQIWICYLLAAIISASVGFYSLRTFTERSMVKIVVPPRTEPKDVQSIDLFEAPKQYLESSEGVALVTESNLESKDFSTKFWCPQTPDQWGEVIYRFDIASDENYKLATLDINVCIFPISDPMSVVEVYVSSSRTKNLWIRLLTLDRHHEDRTLKDPIDVTEWITNADHFKVRFRLKAHRLQYHPTPNDPIGIAGSQCLRQLAKEKSSMALRLY